MCRTHPPTWVSGFPRLVSDATPADHIAYLERRSVEVIRAGSDRVDLAAALETLAQRFGVTRVRTDSGGTLNAVLLELGLVDEVSALVHPVVATGPAHVPFFKTGTDGRFHLALRHEERFDGGEVWLRYDVVR